MQVNINQNYMKNANYKDGQITQQKITFGKIEPILKRVIEDTPAVERYQILAMHKVTQEMIKFVENHEKIFTISNRRYKSFGQPVAKTKISDFNSSGSPSNISQNEGCEDIVKGIKNAYRYLKKHDKRTVIVNEVSSLIEPHRLKTQKKYTPIINHLQVQINNTKTEIVNLKNQYFDSEKSVEIQKQIKIKEKALIKFNNKLVKKCRKSYNGIMRGQSTLNWLRKIHGYKQPIGSRPIGSECKLAEMSYVVDSKQADIKPTDIGYKLAEMINEAISILRTGEQKIDLSKIKGKLVTFSSCSDLFFSEFINPFIELKEELLKEEKYNIKKNNAIPILYEKYYANFKDNPPELQTLFKASNLLQIIHDAPNIDDLTYKALNELGKARRDCGDRVFKDLSIKFERFKADIGGGFDSTDCPRPFITVDRYRISVINSNGNKKIKTNETFATPEEAINRISRHIRAINDKLDSSNDNVDLVLRDF